MRRLIPLCLLLAFIVGCNSVASPTATPAATATITATATIAPTATPIKRISYFFSSDQDGDGEIYAVDESGKLKQLTENNDMDWDPVVSPDGTRLAYVSRRDGWSQIYVMTLASGTSVNVSDSRSSDYEPDWSPDGKSIVFVSERDDSRDIYRLSLNDGHVQRLTEGQQNVCHSPAWSPDGNSIAYSCVREGVEEIYILDLSTDTERQVSAWPVKGRYPAWSTDGKQLAFAGWHEDDKPGLYNVDTTTWQVHYLWQANAPIRNLSWGGEQILFSMSGDKGYDIYALTVNGATLTKLVASEGWDDCATARGNGLLWPVSFPNIAADDNLKKTPPVLGVNLADLGNTYLINDMGFSWIKNYLSWAGVEPEQGQYKWDDPDNVVKTAERMGVKVLMRLHDTPEWARPADTSVTYPTDDIEAYSAFVRAVARRYRGKIAAYEIGNEPNLAFDWGGTQPDPAAYTELLHAAYLAIKSQDPNALVISGGIATTGNGGQGSMGDLDFLRGMIAAGGMQWCDAIGVHPYGFGIDPFTTHPYGLSTARVFEQHQILKSSGFGDKPIWATEVGWPVYSPWDLGEHQQYAVSEQMQALYYQQLILESGYRWPWLQGIFLFNLDFSTAPWYDSKQVMRWYAILEGDGSPRLAFSWLRGVAKQ